MEDVREWLALLEDVASADEDIRGHAAVTDRQLLHGGTTAVTARGA